MSEVTCPYCGYRWVTRSRMRYVTCPRCMRKVPNPLFDQHATSQFDQYATSPSTGSTLVEAKGVPTSGRSGTTLEETKARTVFECPITGTRVLEVRLSTGRTVKLKCTEAGCETPEDLSDEEIAELLAIIYGGRFVVKERRADSRMEIMLLDDVAAM